MQIKQRNIQSMAFGGGFIDFGNRMSSLFLTPSLYIDWGLLFFRLIVAIIFFVHGFQKLHFWHIKHSDEIPKHTLMLFRIVSFCEVVGAASLFMGFFTHVIILGLLVIILGAMYYKNVVWRKGFTGEGGWELDLIMLAGLVLLFFVGPGKMSLDYRLYGF